MSTNEELDFVAEALRSPGRADELAAGPALVGRMMAAHSAAAGRATSLTARLLTKKAAVVAGVALLGTTSAAAAATGGLPFVDSAPRPQLDAPAVAEADLPESPDEVVVVDTTTTAPPTTTTAETATTTTREAEADEPEDVTDGVEPPVDENGDPYGDVPCDEARNHGEYVSSVARDDSIEGNRGAVVRQAAHTDCGKPDAAADDADAEDADDDAEDADDDGDDADDDGDDADDPDKGNGKGNNGNGNGNGGNGNGKGNNGNGKGNGKG